MKDKLKELLIEWRSENTTEWVTAAILWDQIRAGTGGDSSDINHFRYALRSLCKTDPGFIISRSVNKQPAEFKIALPGEAIKKEDSDTSKRVSADRKLMVSEGRRRDIEKKYKAVLKEIIIQDSRIQEMCEELHSLKPPPFTQFLAIQKDSVLAEESAVLVISDAHALEVVSLEETAGLNEYNYAIFVQRVQYMADKIADFVAHRLQMGFKRIYVIYNGDINSGDIHDELAIYNQAPVAKGAVQTGYVFSQMLRDLASIFPQVIVIGVPASNHPRIQKEKRFKGKAYNWDMVTLEVMSAYCRDIDNISFDITPAFCWVGDIEGHTFLIKHGDDIRTYCGVPWYGINKSIPKLKEQFAQDGKIIRYTVLGHYHTMAEMADVNGAILMNGSIKGQDEYCLGSISTGSAPAQLLFGMHPARGMTWRYPIRLDFAPKDMTIRYDYNI